MNLQSTAVLVVSLCVAHAAHAGVAITEVMPDPILVADSDGEWFELFNYGPGAVNLNGWMVTDGEGSITIGNITMPQGDFLVFTVNKTTMESIYFGGVPQSRVIGYPYNTSLGGNGMALANGSDSLDLIDAGSNTVWSVSWSEPPDNRGQTYYLAIDNFSTTTWSVPTNGYVLGTTTNEITPLAGNYTAVPEPAAAMLLLVGVLSIAARPERRNSDFSDRA